LLVYGPSGVKSIFTSAYSGPIALASTYLCLSCLSVSRRELQNILLGLVGPILGIAVIAVFGFVTAADVVFSEDSNLATSGGFGPNQVSTILGLGVLACFLSLFLFTGKRLMQLVLFGVMIFLAAQSAFTFSRSGLYNASVGIVIASLWLLTDARTRTRLVIAIVPAIILAVAVIIPTLNQISGDTLSARFQDTSVSGRDELALIDLNIWLENPLLGVGPGRSREIHRVLHPGSTMAHTEFTRMLAEHGTLGLISIVALALMAWQSFYRAKSPMDKALVGALVGWTIMFMLNSAMRTAGPAFAFGLASIKVIPSTRFSLRTKRTTPRTAFRQL
jgi:O-antigen ligase